MFRELKCSILLLMLGADFTFSVATLQNTNLLSVVLLKQVFPTCALQFYIQGSTFSKDYLRFWQQASSILTDEPEISLVFHLRSLPSWQAFTRQRYDA